MKIGIFDPYLDDLGGGEKYMMTIAETLSKKHKVNVFWDNHEDLTKLAHRFLLDFSSINIVKNIFTTDTSIIKRLRESFKYDVIITLSDGSLPFLLSKKTFIHFQQPFPNIKPKLSNILKINKIDNFLVNSKFTKSFIDKEFDINSKVLYPPVDFYPKDVKRQNIILNVGRFRVKDVTTSKGGQTKGIGDFKKQSVMVDVFKKMVDEGLKDWKFVLAVSVNEHEKEIFKDFKKSAINYPVEFLVNKTNKELWETYSKAKIYWHASGFGEDLKRHPEFAEHFGISTVESMGAGCVPVVINAGGQKEIIENRVNGFLWDTLDQLMSITLSLINDNSKLDEVSKRASASVKKFTKENFEKQINDLVLS